MEGARMRNADVAARRLLGTLIRVEWSVAPMSGGRSKTAMLATVVWDMNTQVRGVPRGACPGGISEHAGIVSHFPPGHSRK